MAQINLLKDLAAEATLSELLGGMVAILSAIHEKMPRVDQGDRLIVSHAESNPTVSLASNQTVGTVSYLGYLGTGTQLVPAQVLGTVGPNSGLMHIYDNIRVS